ncbi:F-actin capping protein alpha subunit (macronuclear) [Tetrahymena thermophila SB210]|uniref:F-actin-capping protein subunit alpha n=1 Tax=Tetrahymena thermophila (strain SB210) TaxID=312017 RepID=W7X8T2_TETTS|nr:F-actin capping protein alpha subunit [Tetrahymena thermophila SB210]EWS75780.1 F-actin capping protein alpha subunit [Tetrahymena thermophila SB210]|eukprot:XP_012651702.1 F-actin capping protein alpha subunit [Tetrahymena thermophila SB210]
MADDYIQYDQQEQPQVVLDENKKTIMEYIIKNAPYGEINDVIADLKKLVDDYHLYESYVDSLLIKHAQDHFAIVRDHPLQSTFLLTPLNYIEQEDCYLDQQHNLKVFVDHKTLKVTRTEEVEIASNPVLGQYRGFIEKGIQEYLKNYYSGTEFGQLVYLDWDEENFTIYIAITCKNLKLNSFHGGEWISDWKIDMKSFEGKVRINSHFFEGGNVMLKETKKFTEEVLFTGSQIENESQKIVKQIINLEQSVQTSLESMYERMSDQFFKNMRRILPVTNMKMSWDASVHKLIANLKK